MKMYQNLGLVAWRAAPHCFNCGAEAIWQCGDLCCPNWLCDTCGRRSPVCEECLVPIPWTAYSIHRDPPALEGLVSQQIADILVNQDCPFCGTAGTWWKVTVEGIPTNVLETFLEHACQSTTRLEDRDWLLSLSPARLRASLAQVSAPIYYCEACAAIYQDLCVEHEEITEMDEQRGPVSLADVMHELALLGWDLIDRA